MIWLQVKRSEKFEQNYRIKFNTRESYIYLLGWALVWE